MTESEFRGELKNLHGGYFFYGDEDYLKFSYSKEVAKAVLDGSFDEFNHIVIYGDEYSATTLFSAISSPPLMAEKKLVEIRGVDFNSLKKDMLSELDGVLSDLSNYEYTILLIRADEKYFNPGRLPKSPSEIYKIFSKYLCPVEFNFPQATRLKTWIIKHFATGNIEFDPTLCDYLVEICGHSMWTLSNEIEKLCAYATQNSLTSIKKEHIDLVCPKTIEYDDFQLTNALVEGDKNLIFETLKRQKANHEEPFAILSSVLRLYTEMLLVKKLSILGMTKQQISSSTKIHEFKVGKYLARVEKIDPIKLERAIELCRDADISSKSQSNVTSYTAVERLISSLCALIR